MKSISPQPLRTALKAKGLIALLGLTAPHPAIGQEFLMDWTDPGWTNVDTGAPSEFLTNSSSNGSGWASPHRLYDVGGSGVDVTFRLSHQPNAWNIENRPALGPYFPSTFGTDGDILRTYNTGSTIPAGELAYYTMEFSRPVTISKFGFEGLRNNDAWQVRAFDWAGNLVEPNWPDPNIAVETMVGDPLTHAPINLLRGTVPEADSLGRYDASETAFYLWNKDNIHPRAAAVIDYNGVVAKKLVFTMLKVNTATGISIGTPAKSSIYLAGGFSIDTAPVGTNPLPQCYLISDDGLRLTAYNHDTQVETDLGDLGVDDIEAITFDPATGTLYGARGDSLYSIDTQTGAASVLGEWSPSSMATPSGALDSMSFNDVDGLARDVASNIWYASARVDDSIEGGSPDLLFQFNPLTGNYIPGAFPGGHDYVRIEKPSTGLHLIDDLSFDPFTRKLYGIANGNGSHSNETTIVEIDPATGNTIDLGNVVYNPGGSGPQNVGDAEGLTITLDRRVMITTGKDGNFPQTLFQLHGLGSGGTIVAEKLTDLGFGGLYTDYEAVTCAVYVNPAEVGGTVFSDLDSDGLFGGSDSGIADVDVQLKDVLTGSVLSTVTTDNQGNYYFGGLPFGSYNVVVADSNFTGAGPLIDRTPTGDPEGDNDNSAAFVAPPLPITGMNQVLSFNGSDDYAQSQNGAGGFGPDSGPFTMTTWVNPALPNQVAGIMAGSSGGSVASQILSQALDRFVFQYQNLADVLVSQTKVTSGFWYHLAATYDGTNLKLYVNGILEAEKTTTQSPSNVNRLTLGRARTFIGEIYFNGRMDATSYWETALTENQIQSLAQLGVTGSEQDLKGFWDWDNGTGNEDAWDTANDSRNVQLKQGTLRTNVDALTALNFGYSAGSKDKEYTNWQQTFSTILAGNDGPTDNHDGDIYSNLLEYALCLHPGTGVTGPGGFLIEGTASNVDAVFWRRAGGHDDLTYNFEGRSELPIIDTETWNILLTIPGTGTPPAGVTVTDLGNGIELVRIADVGDYSPLSPSAGFVRMTVELNQGGSVVASSYTQVFGWKETSFNQGETDTYSNALTKVEQVSGSVELVSGTHTITISTAAGAHLLENVLDLKTKSYYLEVTSGDLEGHRFDITGAVNDTLTLAIDDNATEGPPYNTIVTTSSIPKSLQGDQFLVREHYTLNDYFPPSSLTASATLEDTSDQVYLYQPSGWTVFWLREDLNGDHWTSTTDLTFADTGATVIAPGEGLFVQTAAELSLFAVGPVRKHAFQRPLAAGYNLVASGFPKNQSISERAMTPLAFDGDPNPELADQVCAYDASVGTYHCYFLLESNGQTVQSPRWVHTEDSFLTPADFDSSVFQADRANFLFRANAAKTDYFMPLSWCIGLIGE